jgi:membrane protease YdiL (CAAX protease family)
VATIPREAAQIETASRQGVTEPRTVLQPSVPTMGLGVSAALFGGAGILLYVATHGLIPVLSRVTGAEPIVLWFLVGGLGVFAPMLLVALILLRREGALTRPGVWTERLRFRPMTAGDWLWGLGALMVFGGFMAALMAGVRALFGEVHLQPPFMSLEPLTPGRFWILAAWVPFWVLNIMGEEIAWRGVILPRQEAAFGRHAWLVQGMGWLLFHLAFGWQIMLMAFPLIFLLPYVVQRRQNSWVGVLMHAGLNGPGFIAVAFGLV